MVLICAGALLSGLLASCLLPFLPFAASLVGAILVGGTIAITQGRSVGSTVLSALAILVACQVGYGLRLLGAVLADALPRSRREPVEGVAPMKRLRSERE